MSSDQVEKLSWMNSDYFKSILTEFEGQADLELSEFNVSAGTNKGESYASQVFRVTLRYLLNGEHKETSFILKSSPVSGVMSELLEEMGTFPGETHIYKNVLPVCQSLIPNFKIAPR